MTAYIIATLVAVAVAGAIGVILFLRDQVWRSFA